MYAALLVLFGRLADRYRRDRGFLLGVAVFVAASAACGAATSLPMLVAFRVVQAAGAALLTPTSLGLILATTTAGAPPRRRPHLGGGRRDRGGARAGHRRRAGGRELALGVPRQRADRPARAVRRAGGGCRRVPGHPVPAPDPLGAVLITGGIGALSLGLVKGGAWGWGSAATIGVLALSAVALAGFAVHNVGIRNPLIDRSLFKLRPFTGASIVALLFSAAFGAMLLSRVLWAQDVWHWSALITGLSIAPGPIMVPICSFLVAGPLIARFGPGPVIAAGSTIFAAGVAWWALVAGLEPDYVGEMLGGILLTGIGVGLTLPTLVATGVGVAAGQRVCDRLGGRQHVPPDRAGRRRRRPDRGARVATLTGRRADGVSAGLDRDRGHRACRRGGGARAADRSAPPGRSRPASRDSRIGSAFALDRLRRRSTTTWASA